MRATASLLFFAFFSAMIAGCPPAAPPDATRGGPSEDAAIMLVESSPVETTLDHADIPNTAEVWVAMIDGARRTLDFAEFYASEAEQKDRGTSKLSPVVAAVERAVRRGVKVRFLVDAVFAPKYPGTIARLQNMGAEVRILDFGKRGGGVLHAKYFVVDGVEAFVGSQNFDWRSLAHIQEMGVRVFSPVIAGVLLDVLDTDWDLAAGTPVDTRIHRRPRAQAKARSGETLTLVGSPSGWLPDESAWELPKLVALLDGAARAIDLQVLTYKTKERDGSAFPPLDEALHRAARRGVHVRLLVSDWSSKPGSDGRAALEELGKVPNVEVRVITIPEWSGGAIPFARVAHAKYLVVDHQRAWIGTSNWEGDYFTKSRNVGVIVEGGALPPRLDRVFEDGWSSTYAAPLTSGGSGAPPSSTGPAPP